MENKIKIAAAVIVFIILVVIIAIFMNRPKVELAKNDTRSELKGIIFEGIGEDSVLSRSKKDYLRDKFGNDVSESWSPISFNSFPQSFYTLYFPEIAKLSKMLGSEDIRKKSGENSIKFKYPYVDKNSDTFHEISLIFSNFTKKPLKFNLKAYEPEKIIKNLEDKFSKSREINHQKEKYFVWEKDNSFLVSSIKKDRYGKPYIDITIFYVKNLNSFFAQISPSPGEGQSTPEFF
ncbi:MAG: hypothetical protein ACQEQS_08965 [Thermodesulfobacteriota bacterium]